MEPASALNLKFAAQISGILGPHKGSARAFETRFKRSTTDLIITASDQRMDASVAAAVTMRVRAVRATTLSYMHY